MKRASFSCCNFLCVVLAAGYLKYRWCRLSCLPFVWHFFSLWHTHTHTHTHTHKQTNTHLSIRLWILDRCGLSDGLQLRTVGAMVTQRERLLAARQVHKHGVHHTAVDAQFGAERWPEVTHCMQLLPDPALTKTVFVIENSTWSSQGRRRWGERCKWPYAWQSLPSSSKFSYWTPFGASKLPKTHLLILCL